MSEENVSLPVAQALASALTKIEAYVPTEYVDNSEPDLDAEHLNHAEQGIMRVTNLLNAAVDVIQGQQSRLADAETKIGTDALTGGMTDLSSGLNAVNSDFACAKYASDIFVKTNGLFVYYNANTKNSPYKAGTTPAAEGLCLITGDPDTYFSAFSFDKGGEHICIYNKTPGGVTNWKRLV